MQDCGSCDAGSIPAESAGKKARDAESMTKVQFLLRIQIWQVIFKFLPEDEVKSYIGVAFVFFMW